MADRSLVLTAMVSIWLGEAPSPAYMYTLLLLDAGVLMAAKHCSSSREGKVLLSCWISEDLRLRLDQVWAAQGWRPHGRTQKGMEDMIALYLAAQREV